MSKYKCEYLILNRNSNNNNNNNSSTSTTTIITFPSYIIYLLSLETITSRKNTLTSQNKDVHFAKLDKLNGN